MSIRPAVRLSSSRLRPVRSITTQSQVQKKHLAPPFKQKTIIRNENKLHFAYTSDSLWARENRRSLRDILRECSYLPDSNARRYTKFYALHRFRTVAYNAQQHRDDPEFGHRIWASRLDARKWHNRLTRANQGDRKALLYILLRTYGRAGARRYELMAPLMPVEVRDGMRKSVHDGSEQQDDEPRDREQTGLSKHGDAPPQSKWNTSALLGKRQDDTLVIGNPQSELQSKGHYAAPEMTPQLLALVQSQMRHSLSKSARLPIRQARPVIPTLNTRLLPMPQKRVKNMTKEWYATLLDRILPPLPTAEWNELRSRALGEYDGDIPARRRAGHGQTPGLHFGQNAAIEAIVAQGRLDPKSFGNRESHSVTPRFMRRLWSEVFSQCPHVSYDNESQRWSVVWGNTSIHGEL